jgi:hypothetical protein
MPLTGQYSLPSLSAGDLWGAQILAAINGLDGRRPHVHARDFGINGLVTDDYTAAFETASQQIFAAGGAVLYCPRGIYPHSGISLRTGMVLQGDGMKATELRYNTASNGDYQIRALPSPDGVAFNSFWTGVRNLWVNGNYTQQTAGLGHGIVFTANPLWNKVAGEPAFDTQHIVHDVLVTRCRGDGFWADGRGEHFLVGLACRDNRGNGLTPTADTHLVQCIAGGNLGHGFNLVQASNRLVGCKAFYSGYEFTTVDVWINKSGFYLANTSGGQYTFAGCEAQDNGGPGWSLNGSPNNTIHGAADSNCRFDNTLAAVELNDSRGNVIDVTCMDRYNPTTQKTAVKLTNNSVGNQIRMSQRGHLAAVGAGNAQIVTDGTTVNKNDVTVMTISGTGYTAQRMSAA